MVIVGALLGCGIGFGAWLCVRAFTPRPQPVAALLAGLERPGRPVSAEGPNDDDDVGARLAALAHRGFDTFGLGLPSASTLELVERTPAAHALSKVTCALTLLLVPNLAAFAFAVAGVGPPPGVLVALSVPFAVAGFFLPDFTLRDQAERRRRGFRHALSAYLDLVNILLAGGAGIETALWAAADAGDGWGFQRIRAALHRSRLTGRSPWETFAALGRELEVSELSELASSISLAGSHGARIRASLAAKADTLRGHQVAETEAAAEAATERMTIPLAVLLFGFLVFIAYPAIQQITSASGGGLQP